MSKRTQLIIVAVLFIIGVSVFFGFASRKKTKFPAEVTKTPQNIPATKESEKKIPPLKVEPQIAEAPLVQETQDVTALKTTSIVFASYYGTYGTPNNFTNFDAVKALSTDIFISGLSSEKAKIVAENASYQISTQSLVAKIKSQNETTSVVEVLTKRSKIGTDGKITEFNQRLNLTLVKQGNDWRVDSAVCNPTTF